MMALDKNISALFAEQQKRVQAKKDEKERMRKEKILRRDFKTKVRERLFDVKTSGLVMSVETYACHEQPDTKQLGHSHLMSSWKLELDCSGFVQHLAQHC